MTTSTTGTTEMTDYDSNDYDASTAVATVTPPMTTAIATSHDFSRDQLELIKATVARGTSDLEFKLFIEVCRLTGLNPFAHQIYAIMRNNREQDDEGAWRSVKRMTIQTGIDGYLAIASRTHEFAGMDDVVFDTEEGEHPNWARVTVYRLVQGQRMPFTATARWREYVQTDSKGNPTSMWKKMGWTMLGKCVRALALRLAFPAELGGVYTDDEMAQADNPPTRYVESAQPRQQPHGADASSSSSTSVTDAWLPERDADIKKALTALRFTRMSEQHDYIASLRAQFDLEGWPWDKARVMDFLRAQYKQQARTEAQRQAAAATAGYDLEALPVGESGAGVH